MESLKHHAEKEPADSPRPGQLRGEDLYKIVREDGEVVLTMVRGTALEHAIYSFDLRATGYTGAIVNRKAIEGDADLEALFGS